VTFPSGWELVLVLLVILVLFGAKRLPDSARALGRSMRILKAETKGMRDDDAEPRSGDARRDTTVTAEPLPPAQPAQPYGQQPYQQPAQPYQQPAQGYQQPVQQQPYQQPPPPAGQGPGPSEHGDPSQQPRP
jgi:sec-independent protein translocase protein TatA